MSVPAEWTGYAFNRVNGQLFRRCYCQVSRPLGTVPSRLFGGCTLGYHFVNNAEGFCLFWRHEVVAVERALNDLVGLAGVLCINLIMAAFRFEDVLGMPLDIARLSLKTGGRLMHHHPRIWEGIAHAGFAGRKQKRPHRCSLTYTKC